MRHRWLPLLLILLMASCAKDQNLNVRRAEVQPLLDEHVYFLQANASGHIISVSEVHRLEREVAAGNISEIMLFSFGWNTSMEDPEAYVEFLNFFSAVKNIMAEQTVRPMNEDKEPAMVVIMWDSSFHTFRRMFLDFLPSQGMANAMAAVPDKALFPVSFWSKASLAQQLGHGDLREFFDAMIEADPDEEDPLQFTCLGHSFGCRILAALTNSVNREGEPIPRDRIRAMLFLQPAITYALMPPPERIDGPVVVTFSRNDNSLRLFFSFANMLFNNGVTDGTMNALRSRADNGIDMDMEMEDAMMTPVRIGTAAMDMALTLILIPIDYALIQGQQIIRSPGGWVMDSLAQIPLVSVPVDMTNVLHSGDDWGTLRRGILQFGWVHDSVGSVPPLFTAEVREFNEYSLSEAMGEGDVRHVLPWRSTVLAEPLTIREVLQRNEDLGPGIHYINATEFINHSTFLGFFPYDMNSWYGAHLLRYLDMTGSHNDIRNAGVLTLIDRTLNQERNNR